MSQTTPSALVAGSVFHGRYKVVRTIKSGGMGTVYEVTDTVTNSPRALKVMLPSIVEDADQRARFALEAKVTGTIESDHLVGVFDAGLEASGEPFLVMELLRGEDLQSVLSKRGALPADEVFLYLSQLARVLTKTHAAGIVHRDIKPENLFLTRRDDGSPCLKILDFGIAKVVAHQQAKKTRALGTPLFMAPEQIRGESSIGPQADLYASAQAAYALLTGEAYWTEDSKAHDSLYPLLMKLLSGATEPPSARALRRSNVRLPPGFDAWFLRATAPDPAARFENANALTAALEAVLKGQGAPATTGPVSMPATTGPVSMQVAPTGPVSARTAQGPHSGIPTGQYVAQAGVSVPGYPSGAPVYGTQPTAPVYGAQPTGGAPVYGAQPTGGAPVYGAQPTGGAPVYGAQPTAQAWGAHSAPPQPGWNAAPPAAPAKSKTPVLLFAGLGGGALLVVALVIGLLVGSGGSTPPPAPAGACGDAAVCVQTRVPDAAHVEPIEVLSQARELAQGVDKRAALYGIFVNGTLKDGTIDLSAGYATVMFNFGTPDGMLSVLYRKTYTSVMRSPGFGEKLVDPKCPMKTAWQTAVTAGAAGAQSMSILYQPDPPYGGTVWVVTSQNKVYYVDAATCAMKRAPK